MNFREIEATRRRRAPGLAGEYDYAGAVNDVLGPVAGTPVPGLALGAYEAGRDAARAELQGASEMEFTPDEAQTFDPAPPPVAAPAPGLAPANPQFASPPPVAAPITPPGAPAAPVSSPPLASAPAAPQVPGGTTPQAPPPEAAPGTAPTTTQAPNPPERPTRPTPGNEIVSERDIFGSGREYGGGVAGSADTFSAPGLAGQPMAKDSRRSDKMLGRSAPGLDGYGMTQAEREGLQEARQGDRRMRIAQGVLSGVGGLLGAIGVGTNNAALAGIGAGTRLAGGVIPAGRRAEEVLADYDRRVRGVQAQTEADQRAQQLGIEGERVGVQRTTADANMVQAQGRADLDRQNAQNAELERNLAAGNAEAAREQIRGRIAAMPPGPERDALVRTYARGGAFDQQNDPAILRQTFAQFGDVDTPGESIARTYAGGGQRGQWVNDPVTGHATYVETPNRGRGRGQPPPASNVDPFATVPAAPGQVQGATQQGVAPAPEMAPAAPQAAPAPARGRTRPASRRVAEATPAGSAGAAPAAPPENVIQTGPQAMVRSLEDLMTMQGVPRGGQAWNLRRNNLIQVIESGDASQIDHARAELQRQTDEASLAEAAGQSIGVSPAMSRRLQAEVTPTVTLHREISGVVNRLASYAHDHPIEFRAAISGNPLPGRGNAEAYAQIRSYFAENKHRLTGAAASNAEARDLADSMGLGTLPALSDPDAFLNLMIQRRNDMLREVIRRARNIDTRAAYRFLRAEYPGQEAMIRRALQYQGD